MKKNYTTPEFESVRFDTESLMSELDYSTPHIPGDGGDKGERD